MDGLARLGPATSQPGAACVGLGAAGTSGGSRTDFMPQAIPSVTSRREIRPMLNGDSGAATSPALQSTLPQQSIQFAMLSLHNGVTLHR